MFHLGRISFVASGETPESSKLIFVSSFSRHRLGCRVQESPEFQVVKVWGPKGEEDTALDHTELTELGTQRWGRSTELFWNVVALLSG